MEQNESYIFGVSSFGCLLIQFVTLAGEGGEHVIALCPISS